MNQKNKSQVWLPSTTSGHEMERAYSGFCAW